MSVNIFDTLSGKLVPVYPIDGKTIRLYSCGPTVYNFVHLGNLRAYVFVDFLKRYLKHRGHTVYHVMNLTDIDDKIIQGCLLENKNLQEFTHKYIQSFLNDIHLLNIQDPDVMPRATDHITEMVELIKKLLAKSYAYQSAGSVYFDISKMREYGRLAHLDQQNLKVNAEGRLKDEDEYEKEQASDFVLWKAWKKEDGLIYWDTELGKGRPGWHIECSAMAMKYLGEQFDIHVGGIDLVFPHHTNEIAQSEAVTGKTFSNIWLHNAHLLVNGKKMSKSLGNFYTLRDVTEKGYHPLLVRYVMMRTHYQQNLDFTLTKLDEARHVLKKLIFFLVDLDLIENDVENTIDVEKMIKEARLIFTDAMDDNLNISVALEALFKLISETYQSFHKLNKRQAKKIMNFLEEIDAVFGFLLPLYQEHEVKKKNLLEDLSIIKLMKARAVLKETKNFKEADKIRELLVERGIRINDLSKEKFSIYAENFI